MKTNRIAVCLAGALGIVNAAYATGETTPTSKKYVDDALATKQAIMPEKAVDTIVTYPRTGGTAGTVHIIKDELGDSTSDTGLPTAEAVEAGVEEKINRFVNLPNTNVVTYSDNTYTPTATPIYDGTSNTFGNGLVRASTLNSAVANAARGKFTRVNANGTADANGTLWRVNTVAPTLTITKTLDASIGGTDYCCRSLNGSNNRTNGTCSAATQSALGASGNKSGKWGVVFPDGDVTGKSVCSSLKPTAVYYGDGQWDYSGYYVASSAENTTLDGEYTSQSGNGNISSSQFYCYCKLDAVGGEPVASSWVFRNAGDDSAYCADSCASNCANSVWGYAVFRGAVFGGVAQ